MLLTGSKIDAALLDAALREVLESQFFRGSGQCTSLLRYIVENTRLDREEHLRERVIGAAVFERPHDYDTGNDHIVRSRASEVRKRLAQFYQESGSTAGVRIQIPSGSYRATFELVPRVATPEPSPAATPLEKWVAPGAPAPVAPAFEDAAPPALAAEPPSPSALRMRRSWTVALVALAGLLSVVFWGAGRTLQGKSAFERFWAPMTQSAKPVLIYCGGGFVYKLSDAFLDRYRLEHQLKGTRREFFVDLKNGERLEGTDLVPDQHFVPFGDLAGTARVASTLAKSNKAYDLRYGDDVAFTEFHSSPVVLIGGLNNSWALRLTRGLRYVLEDDDRIVDSWHREKTWVQKTDVDTLVRDDYAVISRLNQSEAGGFVLSIAGIRMYGTRAAADLIGDPVELDRILKDAPAGWQKKNLQIVIHTKVMNEIPVSVNVEAVHFW